MDDLPSTVAPVPSDTVLARRYLDAGGKIVWPGFPPLIVARDADGRATAVDREEPEALLGVDFERFNFDQYAAYVTDEGRRWGCFDWWMSLAGIDTTDVTHVLAHDADGGRTRYHHGRGRARLRKQR